MAEDLACEVAPGLDGHGWLANCYRKLQAKVDAAKTPMCNCGFAMLLTVNAGTDKTAKTKWPHKGQRAPLDAINSAIDKLNPNHPRLVASWPCTAPVFPCIPKIICEPCNVTIKCKIVANIDFWKGAKLGVGGEMHIDFNLCALVILFMPYVWTPLFPVVPTGLFTMMNGDDRRPATLAADWFDGFRGGPPRRTPAQPSHSYLHTFTSESLSTHFESVPEKEGCSCGGSCQRCASARTTHAAAGD